jgi:hypothetical protein
MKRISAVLLAVCMISVMVCAVGAHDKVTYANWGTPVIDGVMEDVWQNAEYIHVADESITDADDETAVADVYSLWDGDYIYFYAVVTDPTVDAELKDEVWNQDAIGFMIDYAYNRVEGENYRNLGDDSYAGYVNVPAVEGEVNYPESPTIFGISEYADAVKSMCVITDTGYEVEIALPLLYKDYQAGDKIGYEICVNNSIGAGTRYSQTVWSYANGDNGSDSWQYTYNMGTLIFNEKPAEPEVVETEAAETEITETETTEETVVTEAEPETVETVETAPQTFDASIIIAVGAAISAASAIAVSKKKH